MYNSNFWRAAKIRIRIAGNRIKLQGRKLSLREGLLSIGRTEVSNPMITGPICEILISGEPTVPSQNWRQSIGEEVWVCEGLLIQMQNGSFPHLRSPDHINLNLWRTRNSPQVRVHEYLCKVQTKKLNRGGKNIQSKHRSQSEVLRSYDNQSNPASQSKPPGFSSKRSTSVQINLNVQILFL